MKSNLIMLAILTLVLTQKFKMITYNPEDQSMEGKLYTGARFHSMDYLFEEFNYEHFKVYIEPITGNPN
jgi:hypothetical protein